MTEPHSSTSCDSLSTAPSTGSGRDAALSRREFVQLLGAGILITVTDPVALAQRRRGGSRGARNVAARIHINRDGTVTVMTGKVEEGQGSRGQLTQAAAEEMRVDAGSIRLIMADTALVPDDGITAGSRTTPSTVPAVRQGAATARRLLTELAARQWNVKPAELQVDAGRITDESTGNSIGYGDLARLDGVTQAFQQGIPEDVDVTPVSDWQVLGTSFARPNIEDLVTGRHRYPSDIVRPGMLYGKVLRPPSFGAELESIDLAPAQAMPGVTVIRDGNLVGCLAKTTHRAEQALQAVTATARWKTVPQVSDAELFEHLKNRAREGRPGGRGSTADALRSAHAVLDAEYQVAFVQHTPMEPRAATAEWQDGQLTVWTGVDGPQRVQGDLARAMGLRTEQVRVIVPDMGGGFGGKHTGEAAEEAARLARAAGCPVAVHWTRAEEFTWAYFRPAAVIQCRAGLDPAGKLIAWEFTNINAGGSAIDSPYEIPNTRIASVGSDPPLRQGAYRCLAATANNFAREAFMDQLAAKTSFDPLEFRLKHLQNSRIRKVLQVAAERFNWSTRRKNVGPDLGVGLACGTEKDSVVAACVEVRIDRSKRQVQVTEVCEAFECGPIQNPANLESQVQGCIMMGLGPALFEQVRFRDGRIESAGFANYRVPRFEDLPKIEVCLVENLEIPSAGAGETPIIAIAPAITNAVFAATGYANRSMPLQLPPLSS